MTLPSLTPGTLFSARWIVGRVLGRNELAVVYEAEESRAARFATLKLLDSALARNAEAWTSFETLTRSLAQIPGDGIARSYEVGLNDGRPFVVSERSVFPTLSRYIAERGAFATRAFRDALQTLAGALDAAHTAGITHGNLKPQNVFVSVDNPSWARIADFGLAELRVANGILQPRTLGWNAPEVSPAAPTPTSDLYVLGLLTFFALSGSPWFSAQRSATASGADAPRSASERARAFGGRIPESLDAWFTRALAKNPAERFHNAIDMAHAFASALDGAAAEAPMSAHPLSATIPVRERSPLAKPSAPPSASPASPLDPNAPTVPQPAVRDMRPEPPPGYSSMPAPPPLSTNPPLAPKPAGGMMPPVSVVLLGLGAFVIGVLVLSLIAWIVLR